MKALFSVLFLFSCVQAFAVGVDANFRIQAVRAHGEYGYRVIGTGKNLTEMRFDCSKSGEVGLVIGLVNEYGKLNNVIIPSKGDKVQCHQRLSKYFHSKRSLAGLKEKKGEKGVVEIHINRGGLFDSETTQKVVLR